MLAVGANEITVRITAAIVGMMIGDALSMPAHWMYDPSVIPSVFGGPITGFHPAPPTLRGSIMALSSTSTGKKRQHNTSCAGWRLARRTAHSPRAPAARVNP